MLTVFRRCGHIVATVLIVALVMAGVGSSSVAFAQSPDTVSSPTALNYTGTLTAVPSVTTMLAGQSTVVTFRANVDAGSCIGTAGYYVTPSGGTLTAADVAVSIAMHNSTQFDQLNQTAYELTGGSPLVIGTVAKVVGTTQFSGPALFELYQATITINKAGTHTFVSTDGPGIGQTTEVSCNSQTYGTATGFSVTVNNSTVSGKVTDSTSGSPGSAIANVTVELYFGATLVGTTTTNATGDYTLTTTGPGNFTVKVVTPSGTPNYVAATATQIAVTVPGNVTGADFEFVTTTDVVATMTTSIPGGYDLSGRTVLWTLNKTAGGTDTGSVALTAGGTYNATLTNNAGDLQIEVQGFNDDWSTFTPGVSALGSNLLCIETGLPGSPGYGQTGAEEGTLIASLQGTVAALGDPADNNVDGFVTPTDYTAFLGSFGCATDVVAPVVRMSAKPATADIVADVVTFGIRQDLRSDGMYEATVTAKTNSGVSGVVVVIEPQKWGLVNYRPLSVSGFTLQGEIKVEGKVAFYFEANVVDGTLPQITLINETAFVSATMGKCIAPAMQPSVQYPFSHAARPGERLNAVWEETGTCPSDISRWVVNMPTVFSQ